MKNLNLLLVLILSAFLLACDKDSEPIGQPEPDKAFEEGLSMIGTRSFNYGILSFASQQEFDEALSLVASMDDEDAALWFSQNYPDFESLNDIYEAALDEVEFLVTNEDRITVEDFERLKPPIHRTCSSMTTRRTRNCSILTYLYQGNYWPTLPTKRGKYISQAKW